MGYFLVISTEDGTKITKLTREELLERITPDEDGETYYGGEDGLVFLDEIPDSDKGCWRDVPDNAVLIIQGEIIKPRITKVATKYEL